MLVFLFNLSDLIPQLTVVSELLTLFLSEVIFKLDDFFEGFLCLRFEKLLLLHLFPQEVLGA